MLYYLDTCIWLNFINKEEPFDKIAKNFLINISNKDKIIISTIILKELENKLGKEKFKIIEKFFNNKGNIILIKTINSDYINARVLENSIRFEISFYDCLHIVISKRLNCTLITRDKELIKIAEEYISVWKPEDLLS